MESAQTYYCENCGKKISGTAKFCRYCGVRQNVIPPESGIQGADFPEPVVPTIIDGPAATVGKRKRAIPAEDSIQSKDYSLENPPIIAQPTPDSGIRQSAGPTPEYYRGEGYSRLENRKLAAKPASHSVIQQSVPPEEEDFEDDDYSFEEEKPRKLSLFAKLSIFLLIILFAFAAYTFVTTVYKPSVEVTKMVDMKKSDWSFQDLLKGPWLAKLSDFTGISNVYSILIVSCGLMCIGFLFWFYYTRQYW